MQNEFTCKYPLKINELRMVNPKVLMMFAFFVNWANENSLPVVITSMIRTEAENRAVGAKSTTHCSGRAIDISSKGWSDYDIQRVKEAISTEFEAVGAVSLSDLKSRPIIHHDIGHGSHFHLQVRR